MMFSKYVTDAVYKGLEASEHRENVTPPALPTNLQSQCNDSADAKDVMANKSTLGHLQISLPHEEPNQVSSRSHASGNRSPLRKTSDRTDNAGRKATEQFLERLPIKTLDMLQQILLISYLSLTENKGTINLRTEVAPHIHAMSRPAQAAFDSGCTVSIAQHVVTTTDGHCTITCTCVCESGSIQRRCIFPHVSLHWKGH